MGLPRESFKRHLCLCFEKPSAIQQRGIVPSCKEVDVIQQSQFGTGKTTTLCRVFLVYVAFLILWVAVLDVMQTNLLMRLLWFRLLCFYLFCSNTACSFVLL